MSDMELPEGWAKAVLPDVLAPRSDDRLIQQGWSPQCEAEPAEDGQWGVLKTTAIQEGRFEPQHNKRLPEGLEARPGIEVAEGDLLMTCAGPRARCGVPCLVGAVRPRLMLSGKIYRFRADDRVVDPAYLASVTAA